jgi:hypothetical protein
MRKKAVQQGRSERRGDAYSVPYVEPLSDARTPLAVFFRILLDQRLLVRGIAMPSDGTFIPTMHCGLNPN